MIEINNLTKEKIKEPFLKKIALAVLGKKKLDLSLALVGQSRIKELNMEYRGKNEVTDVLSFLYGDSGEIVLCLAKIRQNAREYRISFDKELAKTLIHGILHLLGYDHEKNRVLAEKMRKKEEFYFSKFYGKK